jgi:nucleotide-binding universal stress UspA family protein
MFDILVPLDGSLLSERVLPLAATLARTTGGQLRLVEAINLPMGEDFIGFLDEAQIAASDYLQDQAEKAQRTYGLPVSTTSRFGPAPSIILREAAAGVRYVAMSTHARHGLPRAVLGSVAEHILRESPVPVYLLPAAAHERDLTDIKRIVIPLDGSALAQAVLDPAATLARQLGAAITLIRVYEPPRGPATDDHGLMVRSIDEEVDRIERRASQYMALLVRRIQALGVEAHDKGEFGDEPASHILHLAQKTGADLIVMATHGRSGLDRLRHGSVTEQVLRQSTIPLLAFGRVPLRDLIPAKEPATQTLARVAGDLAVGM